jgi:hypothetical protein
MTQLLKHYYLNRDNGQWATNTRFGLMMPKIEHLDVQYRLEDENDIPFMLSHVPDITEHNVTVGSDDLTVYQNNSNIAITSTTERQEDQLVFDPENPGTEPTTQTVTVYDLTYTQPYVVTESVGLTTLSQAQWDSEISTYDTKQQNKRYDVLRTNRDKMLEHTDWMVIKSKETGTNLTTAFKTWRQELRELPNSVGFPTAYPTLPSSLESDSQLQELTSNFNEVRSIMMINDPLPPLPEPELPGE